jgi:hypothetical protein
LANSTIAVQLSAPAKTVVKVMTNILDKEWSTLPS